MSNPFHETLARRIAVQQAAVANVTDDDLSAVVRMLAVAAVANDSRALDRIANSGPAMRALIEAEVDRVVEEQRLALEERKRQAGPVVAADSPQPAEATQPAPHYENAPVTTAESMAAHVTPPGCRPRLDGRPDDMPPPGTEIRLFRPATRPPPAPELTPERYGLKRVKRGETNTDWMGNR